MTSDSDSVVVDIQKLGSDNHNKPTSMLSSLDEWLWVNPNKNALDRPIVRKYNRFWATFSIASAIFILYWYHLNYRSVDGIFPVLFGWCVAVTLFFTRPPTSQACFRVSISPWCRPRFRRHSMRDYKYCWIVQCTVVDEYNEEIRRLVVSPNTTAANVHPESLGTTPRNTSKQSVKVPETKLEWPWFPRYKTLLLGSGHLSTELGIGQLRTRWCLRNWLISREPETKLPMPSRRKSLQTRLGRPELPSLKPCLIWWQRRRKVRENTTTLYC